MKDWVAGAWRRYLAPELCRYRAVDLPHQSRPSGRSRQTAPSCRPAPNRNVTRDVADALAE